MESGIGSLQHAQGMEKELGCGRGQLSCRSKCCTKVAIALFSPGEEDKEELARTKRGKVKKKIEF